MEMTGTKKVVGRLMLLWLLLVGAGLRFAPRPVVAQEGPAARFYALVSQARLNEGLAPLEASTLLGQAAQRHADDIAARGTATHEGSDGSTYQQRIRETGYRAWNDGLMVNETYWLGLGTPMDALVWFHKDPASWELFTDPRYREIGVGYAEDDQGVHYFVITFGARPGVLPIFINDGAEVTDSPSVAVRLTNEAAVPLGEGAWMGRAIEVRLSNSPDFSGTPWQPWGALLPWALEGTEPGVYSVYVEFRDGADRTTISEDTIRLVAPGEVPPTPTPLPPLPPPASGDRTPTGTPPPLPTSPSGTLPDTPSGTPTSSDLPPSPTVPTLSRTTLTPQPTWTPLPILTEEPVETTNRDWPLFVALGLQVLALILGAAAFLRRR
jgi:hypothetical protein